MGVCLHVYGLWRMRFCSLARESYPLQRFQVGDLCASVLFFMALSPVCVCGRALILCSSVSVDECILEANYTRRNVYICAIKLVN